MKNSFTLKINVGREYEEYEINKWKMYLYNKKLVYRKKK